MRFHPFLLLAPLACLAQVPGSVTAPPAAQIPAGPKAPPEVDQALRARVKAFLDFQSKGDFRKAYELVAEGSKDFYFGAPKEKASSFTVDDVQYGADLSTASVKSTMQRQMTLAGHPIDIPQVQVSQWKLEKGEWFWYHDPSKDVTTTIIGDLPAPPVEATTDSPIPKDMSQKAAVTAARNLPIPRPVIDKKLAVFTLGKEATEQVTYHNGSNGQVRVLTEVRGVRDTVTVEPNDVMVSPQTDMAFKVIYKPHPESSLRGEVLFVVEPFGSGIRLPVRFLRERQVPKTAAPAPPAPGNPAAPDPAAPATVAPAPAPTVP